MKDFAKSIVCNTKAGNSNKAEIIEKKKKEGATLKVDNGQKLEFSDGSTYVKTSFSDDYREAHNYMLTKKAGNTKVGNGIKEDMKRAHPNDSMVDGVKTSATYEAIVKQPWRVYDILGVNDSKIREYAFDLIVRKYGINYAAIYYAWLHNGYKLSDHRGPINEAGARRDFEKLGITVYNTRTGTIDWDVANFNGQWYITMNGQKLKGPFPSMKEAERYLDGHKWELQDKYGNAKTGNKKLKFTSKTDGKIEYVYDEESQDGFIYDDGKLVDTIPHAGQGWLNLIKQKAFSSGVMNKTGNRVIEKESEMSQELKNLLKKAPEWIKEKIQYAFSHGFTIDEKDFINAIKKEVGNSKTGNAKDKNDKDLKVGDIVDVRGKKGKITKIIGDVIEVFYDNSGTYNPDRTDRHYADEATKVGNSAQDDKFAYVMREFDEGKLKTPDGKVVTDPAQAKAIAYSESKKTENGLARARKAMNKKVGNHDFEEGDYVLYNGQKAVVRGFNGQEVIIEQNGRRITTHWSNLEEYE